jgi:hypothetical protein
MQGREKVRTNMDRKTGYPEAEAAAREVEGEAVEVLGPDENGDYAARNARGKGKYGWVVYGADGSVDRAVFPTWPPRIDLAGEYRTYVVETDGSDLWKLAVHPCWYRVGEDEVARYGFAVATAPGLSDVLFIVGRDGRLVRDVADYQFVSGYGVQGGGMYLLPDQDYREVQR